MESPGQTEKRGPKKHLAVERSGRDEELGPHLDYIRKISPEQDEVEKGNRWWPKLKEKQRA